MKRGSARQSARSSGRMPPRSSREAFSHREEEEGGLYQQSSSYLPGSDVIVPDDAVTDLTEQQLDEDISRMLYAKDPKAASEIASYSFGENQFRKIPAGSEEHTAVHLKLHGSLMTKNSEEATAQLQNEKSLREEVAARKRELERKAREEGKTLEEMEEMEDTGGKNQFNYSERAAQTYAPAMKHSGVSTKPPETATFRSTFTQWHLYDSYVKKYHQQLRDSEEAPKSEVAKTQEASDEQPVRGQRLVQGPECSHALRILERMVNQNAQDEIYFDFKYWEDASDKYRGNLGTLLPLWRFYDQRVKKKMVTAMAWNPRYPDLFAVGYGSYDFMKQGSGAICIYTLKNVSYPEYYYITETGVMCMDFHPHSHALLAVGCYDGTVKVYDIRRDDSTPLYVSDIKSGKHTDPVWEVKWQDDVGSDMHFFSVSSDGRVANWVLSKNELKMEPVMSLKLAPAGPSGNNEQALAMEEDSSLTGLAGGCCLDFNKYEDHLFLVGTEEGRIHKCSKAYSGQYLETYDGHHMAVYAVRWNPFHPKIFISCSADWTIKIWHHEVPTPILTFDLNNSVGDVAWAPYSSTVFAAVTSNGKTLVFDLDVNKHEQLCEQKIVKKAKLTHVCFNAQEPIVLVGDTHGSVNSLKLSPNLRKITPIPQPEQKKGEPKVQPPPRGEIEIKKLEKLLAAADTQTPALSSEAIDKITGKEVPEETQAAEEEEES